jgi:phage gp46-like protein
MGQDKVKRRLFKMDFTLSSVNGKPTMGWLKSMNITSNIVVLTSLRKGSFFQNPSLGNELFNIKKLTDQNVNLAKQYIEEALAPLLQTGRATSIAVTTERDSGDVNRLNYKVEATQPDGLIITYVNWYSVI